MFKALVLQRQEDALAVAFQELDRSDLPDEEVLIAVKYSSINYKDALAVTGKGKIVRGSFPFVPGIDLVGEVISSKSSAFKPGDKVIGNGWGLGEAYWGGYTQEVSVKSESLIPLPEGMGLRQAMTLGTAGFTAMLSVMALEAHGVTPEKGEVVVTGATGGVGSVGVLLLSALGFEVVASTGKATSHAYLKELGASRIIDRSVLGEGPNRALDKGKWAGAIDNVGGPALAALISQMKRRGSIAACGLANSMSLETTVFPFILRGVNLLGIDSTTCPYEERCLAWQRLTEELPSDALDNITKVISLSEIPEMSKAMMNSKVQGRIVVDVNQFE